MSDFTIPLGNVRGPRGYAGQDGARGSLWHVGTAIDHQSGTATPETGINGSLVGDMYINSSTADVYRCSVAGDSGVAVWEWKCNIHGADGTGALTKAARTDGYEDVSYQAGEGDPVTFKAQTRATLDTVATGGLVANSDWNTDIVNSVVARGDVVGVRVEIKERARPSTSIVTDSELFSLPEGCRPALPILAPALVCAYYSYNNVTSRVGWLPGTVSIGTGGVVSFRSYPQRPYLSGGVLLYPNAFAGLILRTSFMRA